MRVDGYTVLAVTMLDLLLGTVRVGRSPTHDDSATDFGEERTFIEEFKVRSSVAQKKWPCSAAAMCEETMRVITDGTKSARGLMEALERTMATAKRCACIASRR